MRRIKMRETKHGSNDGINIEQFEKGKVYTVSDRLGDNFVNQQKIAVDFEEKAEDAAPSNKAEDAAPDNKARKRASENKSRARRPRVRAHKGR